MSKLNEFRDMIDSIDDTKVLESGQDLLRDMINLAALKQKVAEIESGLTSGGRAIFYFFAEELDEDEVVFAAERVSGRIKRLNRKSATDKKDDSDGDKSVAEDSA
tara:strand:- start:366 stop:680 length:315 start_codon:yes stop_codon:yes gene_type:complete